MGTLQGLSNGEADLAFGCGEAGGAEDTDYAEWKKFSLTRLFFHEFGMSDQNTDALKRERALPDRPGELMATFLFVIPKPRCFGSARAGYEGEARHGFDPKAVGSPLGANRAGVTHCFHPCLGFVFLV